MPFKLKAFDACDIFKWKLSHFFSHKKVWLFDKDHNPSLEGFGIKSSWDKN